MFDSWIIDKSFLGTYDNCPKNTNGISLNYACSLRAGGGRDHIVRASWNTNLVSRTSSWPAWRSGPGWEWATLNRNEINPRVLRAPSPAGSNTNDCLREKNNKKIFFFWAGFALTLVCWWLTWPHKTMTKSWEMTETLAHGYMTTYMIVVNRAFLWLPTVWMIFIIFCIFVHWTKITSVSEGLTLICWWWLFWQKQNDAKKLKNERNPGTSVLIWVYSARALQWIPTRQGLDGFQKSLGPCNLDKNILGIGRVDPGGQGTLQSAIQPIYAECNSEQPDNIDEFFLAKAE